MRNGEARPSGRSVKWLLIAGFVLALVLPDVQRGVLDGLPITHDYEAFLLVFVFSTVFIPARFFALGAAWQGYAMGAALALLLPIRLVSWNMGEAVGVMGCYRSLVKPLPSGACEFSADSVFDRRGDTRTDTRLDFRSSQWRLGFLNTNRFNIYPWEPGNILRDRLPMEVRWRGPLWLPADARSVEIELVGETSVSAAGERFHFKAYDPVPHFFSLPLIPGLQNPLRVDILYRFEDGSRSDLPLPPNPLPLFRLLVRKADGSMHVYDAASPGLFRVGPRLPSLSYGVSLVGLLLFLGVAAGAWIRFARSLLISELCLGSFLVLVPFLLVSSWWTSSLPVQGVFVLLVAWILFSAKQRRLGGAFPWPLSVAAISLMVLLDLTQGVARFNDMAILGAGQDWLTYESFAFEVLREFGPRGGEDVFGLQPFYRYWLAVLHLLFGDSLIPIRFVERAVLGLLVVWVVIAGVRPLRAKMLYGVGVALAIALAGIIVQVSFWNVVRGLSETLVLILLVCAVALWFSGARLAATAMLAGLAAITRFNLLLACVGLVVAMLVLKKKTSFRDVVLVLGGAGVPLLLPVLHNWFYGGQIVLLPTGFDQPPGLGVRVQDFFRWPWEERVWEHLSLTGRNLSGWMAPQVLDGQSRMWLTVSFAAAVVAMTAGAGLAVLRRSWRALSLTMIPVLAWAPFIVYKSDVYYPRLVLPGGVLGILCLIAILKEAENSLSPINAGLRRR
jgi:hypothetical protein